jgi:hypothetical protein
MDQMCRKFCANLYLGLPGRGRLKNAATTLTDKKSAERQTFQLLGVGIGSGCLLAA